MDKVYPELQIRLTEDDIEYLAETLKDSEDERLRDIRWMLLLQKAIKKNEYKHLKSLRHKT